MTSATSPLGRLQVGDDDVLEINSADELRAATLAAADRARASGHPHFVELTLANADTLSMGVGLDLTVLSFVNSSNEPPYYVSKAEGVDDDNDTDEEDDEDEDGEDFIEFDYGGEWSEFPLTAAVPFSVGLNAFVEFLTTGRRSEAISWEEA